MKKAGEPALGIQAGGPSSSITNDNSPFSPYNPPRASSVGERPHELGRVDCATKNGSTTPVQGAGYSGALLAGAEPKSLRPHMASALFVAARALISAPQSGAAQKEPRRRECATGLVSLQSRRGSVEEQGDSFNVTSFRSTESHAHTLGAYMRQK
jgi:hypothetical protein